MSKMDISIIIPCFNAQEYLLDALESVRQSNNLDNYRYEIVIVNDGSTHPDMLKLLEEVEAPDCTIIHQPNKGPGSARNTGIRHATGKFLLLLDSDNKVRRNFIDLGIWTLERHQTDILYGQPAFFGESEEPRFKAHPFNLQTLLKGNYIDTCSIMRRKVWEDIGGFDEEKIVIGHEDWDFWIRAGKAAKKFHFLDEVLYDYRISGQSLIMRMNEPSHAYKVHEYVYQKNIDLIMQYYNRMAVECQLYRHDKEKPLRSFVKYTYNKLQNSKLKSIRAIFS